MFYIRLLDTVFVMNWFVRLLLLIILAKDLQQSIFFSLLRSIVYVELGSSIKMECDTGTKGLCHLQNTNEFSAPTKLTHIDTLEKVHIPINMKS